MISYSDIYNIFHQAGIDIYEYNVELNEEQINTPFLVYQATSGDNFGADGINYIKLLNVTIVMVDETMNFPLQSRIENIFSENDISFDKSINFDDEQRLYSVQYFISVIDDADLPYSV